MWSSMRASQPRYSSPMQPISAKSVEYIIMSHAPGRLLMAKKFGGLMHLMGGHLLQVAAQQALRTCPCSSMDVLPKLSSTPLCQGSHSGPPGHRSTCPAALPMHAAGSAHENMMFGHHARSYSCQEAGCMGLHQACQAGMYRLQDSAVHAFGCSSGHKTTIQH